MTSHHRLSTVIIRRRTARGPASEAHLGWEYEIDGVVYLAETKEDAERLAVALTHAKAKEDAANG